MGQSSRALAHATRAGELFGNKMGGLPTTFRLESKGPCQQDRRNAYAANNRSVRGETGRQSELHRITDKACSPTRRRSGHAPTDLAIPQQVLDSDSRRAAVSRRVIGHFGVSTYRVVPCSRVLECSGPSETWRHGGTHPHQFRHNFNRNRSILRSGCSS